MGIFSFFARKAVGVFPSYVKAPSSSSGLSSRSDSTDSEHIDSPASIKTSAVSRPCLKSSKYDEIEQEIIRVEFSPTNDHLHYISAQKKPSNRVSFASELEQVNFIENFCNDPSLELWSTRVDYVRRYTTDLATVKNGKSNYSKKRPSIGEHEYLTACNVAYHQFCLTGSVDKSLQRSVLTGIECGYRALERFTSDHQLRRELSQRIRKSTVLLYQSLGQYRTECCRNGTPNNTDTYLRAHIESLNFHHIRWALFLGRLDRLAARHCMQTKVDKAMIQSNQTATKKRSLFDTDLVPGDHIVRDNTSATIDLPLSPAVLTTNDEDMIGLEVFSASVC